MNGRWCIKAAVDQNSKFEGLLLSRCVPFFQSLISIYAESLSQSSYEAI